MHVIHAFLNELFHRYEWAAVGIGLVGNLAFFAGSVCFAIGLTGPSKALFIVGSGGMLVRSLARLYVDRRDHRRNVHGHDGGEAMAEARRDVDAATV